MKEHFNYELQNNNTFHVKSIAKHVFSPQNIEEFVNLIQNYDEELIILGNASNILFASSGVNDTLVLTNNLNKIYLENDFICAECGVKSPVLSSFAKDNSITGFEFLYPIPSFIGGNIVMNASCHNQKIEDVILSVDVFNFETKTFETLEKSELEFGYRTSVFKKNPKKYAILRAKYKIQKGEKDNIEKRMENNLALRREIQPALKFPNAGSIFKNPNNESAGRLLDLCNMKGKKIGGACVYMHHANFIVNVNNATSSDIIDLMYEMFENVYEKFQIKLSPEIIFLGEKTENEGQKWKKMQE